LVAAIGYLDQHDAEVAEAASLARERVRALTRW
jgi:hypothetical protein